MITRIRMTPTNNSQPGVTFNFGESNYRILEITGLEPPKANIVHEGYSLIPGSTFIGGSPDIRNIVFTLGLHSSPGSTIQDLYHEIYSLVDTGSEFWLWFWVDGSYHSRIKCYLESYDPVRFTKTPTLTISAISTDIYLQGNLVDVLYDYSTAELWYQGDHPSGFTVSISILDSTLDRINLVDPTNNNFLYMTIPYEYRAGDTLVIETMVGERVILVRRPGSTVQRLLGRATVYEWPLLKPGANRVRVQPTMGSTGRYTWSLVARDMYRGI